VILTVPFSLLLEFLISIILGQEKIITYNKINIFQAVFQLIAVSIFLLIFKQGVFGAIISYVLTIIFVTLLVVLFIKKYTKIYFSYNKKIFKDLTKYGVKAYFGILAQFLNYRLDMFMVALFLTTASVGYYSIAVVIAEKLWMLPGTIATVLFPRISSIKDTEANNLTPRIARHTFFIIFIISLILAMLTVPIIKILFGIDFLPSAVPLLILLPGIVALGGAKTLTADMAGRGKPQFGTYAAFTSLAVNFPLNLWLIPRWGISGAAFASSIAYIIFTLVVIGSFSKISQKSWSDILIIKKTDFQDYKNFLYKIRKRILNNAFLIKKIKHLAFPKTIL
jgi:O-antigen/teichoic acid export membrane protein